MGKAPPRHRALLFWVAAVLFAAGLVSVVGQESNAPSAAGVSVAQAGTSSGEPGFGGAFAVHIRKPAGAPRVDTGLLDHRGRPATVGCATCHTTRAPNPLTVTTETMKEAHLTLVVEHGARTCLSCHHPEDYSSLRLADGRKLPFPEVMELCGQCHGTQRRDYRHGAHGGMTGYWDLTRGSRQRNNCIDCHDPHVPRYVGMAPAPAPRDRFLDPHREHDHE